MAPNRSNVAKQMSKKSISIESRRIERILSERRSSNRRSTSLHNGLKNIVGLAKAFKNLGPLSPVLFYALRKLKK